MRYTILEPLTCLEVVAISSVVGFVVYLVNSLSTTKVLFGITFTRRIKLNLLLDISKLQKLTFSKQGYILVKMSFSCTTTGGGGGLNRGFTVVNTVTKKIIIH